MENLYTKIDLSEQLSLSIGTIDNHMKSGNLKYLKIGKAVRFKDSDIDEWLLKHYTLKYMGKTTTPQQIAGLKSAIIGE